MGPLPERLSTCLAGFAFAYAFNPVAESESERIIVGMEKARSSMPLETAW